MALCARHNHYLGYQHGITGSFQISHLLTLPDQHALHFSQCLGSVSASLFPASALLASTIVNPFSIYQLWPTSLFKRYHRVVVIIACTLYVTHMMIAFTRIDLEPVGQTLLLSLWTMVLVSMALKHLLNYRQIKFVPRIDIGARAAIIVIMVLHAPLTRIYVLETLLIIFVACGLKADVSIESRPVAQQNTSGTDRSSTNKDNPSEQYVLLQPYSPVSPESPPSPGTAHVLVEYKSKVAFTLQNNPALFTTLYAKLARLVLPRVDSPDTLQQDSGCVAMFSAKHNPTSDERMAIFFKGEHSISRDMLYLLDTHTVARILIIASGISGYLAYPAYYDTLRRRASANVQFCLALGVKPRIWPKPRRVLKLQILETTDDKICLYGSSAENKIATIEAIIRDAVTLDGRLMVLVFGPESLAIKTRVHLRPWAVRRGDIELHHINCEKS